MSLGIVIDDHDPLDSAPAVAFLAKSAADLVAAEEAARVLDAEILGEGTFLHTGPICEIEIASTAKSRATLVRAGYHRILPGDYEVLAVWNAVKRRYELLSTPGERGKV